MGNEASTRLNAYGHDTATKPLVAQRHFEATIHKRFIKPTITTLEFEDQFWNKPHEYAIEIRDPIQNKVLFKVPPPPKDETAKRRILCDAYGVPVVGMEQQRVAPDKANCTEFTVIPGGFAATNEIFRFQTRFTGLEHPLTLALNDDPSSTTRVRIFVLGQRQWLARGAVLAIQRDGELGSIFMIARQSPLGDVRDGKYRLEVAAGVDLALVVLFAAAMDETNRQFESSLDRRNVRDRAKDYEKMQKKTTQERDASRRGSEADGITK